MDKKVTEYQIEYVNENEGKRLMLCYSNGRKLVLINNKDDIKLIGNSLAIGSSIFDLKNVDRMQIVNKR